MALRIVSLASGSKGNCTLILSDKTALLCDAGISLTRITQALQRFGLTLSMLEGVVITHEHSDHINALPRLGGYTGIYAHPLTAKAIFDKQGGLKNYREEEYYENGFTIGDIKVIPFRIPHDAAYPLAYTFECEGRRVSVATDMGIPTRGVLRNIENSEVVLLEANHDVEMLKNGSYAPCLKARILGTNGHLSNDASAIMAERLIGSSVKTLLLGHLSENNNTPDRAFKTVTAKLKAHNCDEIEVNLALQDSMSDVFEVK